MFLFSRSSYAIQQSFCVALQGRVLRLSVLDVLRDEAAWTRSDCRTSLLSGSIRIGSTQGYRRKRNNRILALECWLKHSADTIPYRSVIYALLQYSRLTQSPYSIVITVSTRRSYCLLVCYEIAEQMQTDAVDSCLIIYSWNNFVQCGTMQLGSHWSIFRRLVAN